MRTGATRREKRKEEKSFLAEVPHFFLFFNVFDWRLTEAISAKGSTTHPHPPVLKSEDGMGVPVSARIFTHT
jgi:hypothetical protein